MKETKNVRVPHVAGRFYPADEGALRRNLNELCPVNSTARAVAVMVPHAGYVYSGATAGIAFSQIEITPSVIVLCPNHTGRGRPISIWREGVWRTPLGEVAVDSDISDRILERIGDPDHEAHIREHAIEVQIPFLQYRRPEVRIVPIVLSRLNLISCIELGGIIADVAQGCLIVASTDMSHFIPRAEASRLDAMALKRVEQIDPKGLFETVSKAEISMCGYIPTTVMLSAAHRLGAKRSRVLEYTDSGAVTGDVESVVGYASAIID